MYFFDEAARAWDDDRRRERAKVLANAILDTWRDAPGKVLDFGCGSGLIAFTLAPRAGMIYGYDPSQGMERVFLEKSAAYHANNVRFVNADQMRAERYDAIVSSMVLHHVQDVGIEVARLKQLLAPGGRFYWIDLDLDGGALHADEPDFDGHDGFKRLEVFEILRTCGFREVSIRTVFEGEKAISSGLVKYSLFMAMAGE
jgi:ubiquinone/menaquinone biosynthesis C-methylase UbiE